MPAGRPTSYTPELIERAKDYLDNFHNSKDVVPSLEGFAIYLGIHSSTVYEWLKEPDKEEFSDIVERIMDTRAQMLQNKGLEGVFNSNITKLLLSKHGYVEKSDVTTDGKAIQGVVVLPSRQDSENGQTQT